MAGPLTLRNAVDTFVNGTSGYTTKNYGISAAIRLRTGGAGDHRGLIFFTRPFPLGATIISAKLRLYVRDGTWSATTVTAQRASAKWSANIVTYATQPGVTGATATSAGITGGAGTEILIDVTAIMQAVSSGGAWYGFRLTAAGSGNKSVYSAQTSNIAWRPTLEITWVDAPKAPTTMSPSGNRAVNVTKPILTFDYTDPSADSPLSNVQVQVDAAANWSAPAFDSGTVASALPQLDLSTTAYAGLTVGSATWWRVRVQDAAGLWSPWSHTVNGTGNQFRNIAKGTVTINNPAASPNNFVWDSSPPIDWTVTGVTQKHYQVILVDSALTGKVLWDSGKLTGTTTVVTPPGAGNQRAVIGDSTKTYRVYVRIWDTIDREQNGTNPAYTEAFRDFTYNYDGTVSPVTSLVAADNPGAPAVDLTWNRASQPDFWLIRRNGKYVDEEIGSALFVSGTAYKYTDWDAIGREQATYEVLAVVNSRQSASNPTINWTPAVNFPWLYRPDGTDIIALVGKNAAPSWSADYLNDQEIHDVVGDYPPVVITQSIGGYAGHVAGMLADDVIAGVSAKTMRDRIRNIRKTPGAELVLRLANETMRVAAYNITVRPDTSPSKVSYWCEFDYIQVVY